MGWDSADREGEWPGAPAPGRAGARRPRWPGSGRKVSSRAPSVLSHGRVGCSIAQNGRSFFRYVLCIHGK